MKHGDGMYRVHNFSNPYVDDVEAVVPAPKAILGGGYLKLERRVGDFATVGVAVAVERDRGLVVSRAGIGLTGVGGSTIDARAAADALVGHALSAQVIDAAADLAAQAADPHADHRGSAEYKRNVVRTFTARLLHRVAETEEMAA